MSERDFNEGRSLAERTAAELVALSWEELDGYEPRDDRVTVPNGRTYRVKSEAYWDMDAWQSDLLVSVKVYAARGWHHYWPHTARALRSGEDLPEQPQSPK